MCEWVFKCIRIWTRMNIGINLRMGFNRMFNLDRYRTNNDDKTAKTPLN